MSRKLLMVASVALAQLALADMSLGQSNDAPTGVYVGGGITESRFNADTFSVDHKQNSWKAIAGVRLHPNLAIEADYVDFGKAKSPAIATGGPFATSATAYSLFAVGLWPINNFDLYAKAGAARTRAEGGITGVHFSDSSTAFAYGAGAQWRLNKLALRAEYEKYNVNSIRDLDLITLGATYTFGKN